jgi:predicted Zn finger-like uncharacterized protein
MILTCPECATSYFVDDGRIPPAGRKVRCSSCGHRWTAGPDGPLAPPDEEGPPTAFPSFDEPEDEGPPADDIEATPVEAEAVAEPEPEEEPAPRPRPARAPPRRAPQRSSALVWAGAAALAAALIAGVIVFREQIVRVWPKSSAAYAGLGLSVGGAGLVLQQVHVEPAFLAGRPVLAVSGAIRNLRDQPVKAPPVRLTLFDRSGQPVAAKIARPVDATIPPRAERRFAITMLDPPATARDLEVRFETAADAHPPVHAAVGAPSPAPAEATPAPATDLAAPSAFAPGPAPPAGVGPSGVAPPPEAATLPVSTAGGTERG